MSLHEHFSLLDPLDPPERWLDLPTINGWRPCGDPYEPPRGRRSARGQVELRGNAEGGDPEMPQVRIPEAWIPGIPEGQDSLEYWMIPENGEPFVGFRVYRDGAVWAPSLSAP